MRSIGLLDTLALVVYLGAIAAITFGVAVKQRTTEQYFVAGRSLPGWAVAFSVVGTLISSVSFIAFPAGSFARDFRLLVPNLMVPVVLVFVSLVIVPFYRRTVKMTSYEYLEQRFGLFARVYGSLGFVVLRVVDLGFTLLLAAIAVEVIAGWHIQLAIAGIAAFTIAYAVAGGIEAVVWNDVVQGAVLAAGAVCIVAAIAAGTPGGAVAIVRDGIEAGKFGLGSFRLSLDSFSGSDPTFWMFAAAGLAHFGRSYIVEQNMVQRYLLARTEREAKRATLTGAALCMAIWVTFTTIGVLLWGFFQRSGAALPAEIAGKPDNILPYFIGTQLPGGIVGLLIAAVIASAMQSFAADLNSVATVVTQDYFARFAPGTRDRTRLVVGRAVVLAAGCIAGALALFLVDARNRALYETFVTWSMLLASGTLGLFALGFLNKRATRAGAYTGIAVCLAFVFWAVATRVAGIRMPVEFTLHPIMIGVLSHGVLFIAGSLASELWPSASQDKVGERERSRRQARG